MTQPKHLWARFAQLWLGTRIAKFALVGASGVLVNSAALFVLYQHLRLPLPIASVLATELAVVNNFYWNDRWTFARRQLSIGRLVRFHLIALGGILVTTGTLWLLVRSVGVHYLVANGAGIILATLWNYQANRLWTWRAPDQPDEYHGARSSLRRGPRAHEADDRAHVEP